MGHAATGKDIRGFLHRGRQFLWVLAALIRRAGRRRSTGRCQGGWGDGEAMAL